jgi:hypothetical protein
MRTKITYVLIIIFTVITSYFIYSYFNKSDEGQGLTRVQGYDHNAACLSVGPECGYCPGTVVDKQCYVNIDELSNEEKGYLGL